MELSALFDVSFLLMIAVFYQLGGTRCVIFVPTCPLVWWLA